ncbi:MAG: extracellular solute-binding protein [Ruminococcaceae bacterium]|nr:extracellular solute-binding protein [Oscillospiraceae bacterium]
MGKAKFIKLMALLLALTFLVGGGTVAVSAADSNQSESQQEETKDALAEIKELLNAISYGEYSQKYSAYKKATQTIEINATEGYITTAPDVEIQTVTTADGEEKGLYTSSEGEVSWIVNVPESAKYAIKIRYYPVVGKAAPIERVFKINDKVPFGEARYLTLSKTWASEYELGLVFMGALKDAPAGEVGAVTKDQLPSDIQAALAEFEAQAAQAGFTAEDDIGWVLKEEITQNIFGKNKTEYNVYATVKFPEIWTVANTEFVDSKQIRFFKNDIENNELRPNAVQTPEWIEYSLRDSSGYYTGEYEFYLEAGENKLTLQGQNEPAIISSITLCPAEEILSYEDYIAELTEKLGSLSAGKDEIKLEAEHMHNTSSKTIYAIEDRTSAVTSPADTTRVMLNTVGGAKWQTAGQWISFTFTTGEDGAGMYDIVTRFRQSVLDGMFVCRSLQLYSEGLSEGDAGYYNGAPFAEAQRLQYNYDSNWQTTGLASDELDADGKTKEYAVYLAANTTYTLKLEVTLGTMGDIVRDVEEILNIVNDCYLEIIKLTGTTPDEYTDYSFSRVMPDVLVKMVVQSRRLDNDNPEKYGMSIAEKLTNMAGQKSSNVGTLQKVADLLHDMGTDEDEIAKNLETLKGYIGTLGTFLSSAKTQPLEVDYLVIRGSEKYGADSSNYKYDVKANANIFQAAWHEIKSFVMSFFRDYNSMGSMSVVAEEGAVEVWLATGRDQSQVIRNLVNNDFSPNETVNSEGEYIGGTAVDLKLVAAGTLLPSILADQGPDVYLGLGQADVINYAIRSALLPVDEIANTVGEQKVKNGYLTSNTEWDDAISNFNDAAMLVLGVENPDGDMHYYGLPEAQGFTMMFVREDILAELDIPVPETWDDIMAAIPDLQANNMMIGLSTDYSVYLYQANGDLYADNGMRINLDSKKGLTAFEKMCNMFTQYNFPYTYDAANRFRTGEMPILISDYTGMYNQLKVFATEIEGLWKFYPMPGTICTNEDGETYINRQTVSSVAASVIVKGCSDEEGSWNFIRWFTGADCQQEYSNEMVAIIGPAAKYNTANRKALEELPWTTAELEQIQAQFEDLASVPNYPGSYILGRYTQFAFLAAYNDNANPSEALMSYITTINKEITRKRKEFGLETLEVDETLATKRLAQSEQLLAQFEELDAAGEYAEEIALAKDAIKRENIADIANASAAFLKVAYEISTEDAIMKQFNAIKNDPQDPCYSYQVYLKAETPELIAYCLADFLGDASVAMESYQ